MCLNDRHNLPQRFSFLKIFLVELKERAVLQEPSEPIWVTLTQGTRSRQRYHLFAYVEQSSCSAHRSCLPALAAQSFHLDRCRRIFITFRFRQIGQAPLT